MLTGFDLSHHQDPNLLDWPRLAAAVDFLILRATYGTKRDRLVLRFTDLARQHGVQRLAYYAFFRPSQPADDQRAAFETTVYEAGMVAGDGCPWVDIEDDPSPYMQPVGPAWGEPLQRLGEGLLASFGELGGYCNVADAVDLGDGFGWWRARPGWCAHWTAAASPLTLWQPWTIWQHAVKGAPGIYPGKLDHNRAREWPRATRIPRAVGLPRPSETTPADLAELEQLRRAKQRAINARLRLAFDAEAHRRDRAQQIQARTDRGDYDR
jgi:hypothetical protein